MPFFIAATLLKRLDFSVGLAEQRSYIIPRIGGIRLSTVGMASFGAHDFSAARLNVQNLYVNEKMYLPGNTSAVFVVFLR